MPTLAALVLAGLLAAAPARAADPDAAWRDALSSLIEQAWQADPTGAAAVAALPAVPTRAGTLHLAAPEGPWAQVLLADRLVHGDDPPEVRLATAAVYAPRGFELPEITAGLVDAEADPAVRATLLHGLRKVDADVALPRLRAALADADARVRLEAAVVAGAHADGGALADALVPALADTDAAVRGRAARALGRHAVADAWQPLRARLADADPTVRLQALRALERLDASAVAALPELSALAADPDARVARAAAQLAASPR